MKITDERKKEIDSYDDSHIYYFRNIYSEEERKYICQTRENFKVIFRVCWYVIIYKTYRKKINFKL